MVIFLGDWEMDVTRSGDIDTDGEPIGWKIVGIGEGGSVLCEKPNGQRRRYSFGDWAKEQPSGEAWEKLLNVVADYSRNVGLVGPHGEKVKEAWKAYEAAQSAESKFGECETCGVGQHLPSGACDHCGTKKQEDDPQLAKLLKACRNAYNAGPGARRVLLGSVLHEWAKIDLPSQSAEPSDQQATIERLTKERDEARAELANERSVSDQVIDERNATIAELRSELGETRTESHAYKSRLREFCQRLVDMVGAEGPEDVQGMLDKVNAEINRLKQSIDSLSANLADKEGFLNSAGDEIEVLTKERDEALRELANERSRSGQVTTAQINVIAELQEQIRKLKVESATQTDAISEREDRIDQLSGEVQRLTARLAAPEMPEVVRVDKSSKTGWLVGDIVRCRHHSGVWRVWRVYGVFLGAVNQESVIELECLDKDANSQGWACVPEDLLDLLTNFLRPLEG
jgi:DNA repair exonuclease SbcCD ATPase subunit